VANLTSEPALVRQPVVASARRVAEASGIASVQLNAVLNHLGPRPRDSVGVVATGIWLPSFDLPGLPIRAELGKGTSRLDFLRIGDRVAARWIVRAADVTWHSDSARTASLSPIEALVARVISGLGTLDLTAELTGELRAPALSIRDASVSEGEDLVFTYGPLGFLKVPAYWYGDTGALAVLSWTGSLDAQATGTRFWTVTVRESVSASGKEIPASVSLITRRAT
jgi:hypothetical protein